MTSNPSRLTIRTSSGLCVLLTAVLSLARGVAGGPADEDLKEHAAQDERRREALRVVVDVRKPAEAVLRERMSIVDRLCALTPAQRQKLELAGRGDVNKILEPGRASDPMNAALWARRGFHRPELPADESLFLKLLDRLLTAEQGARYSPLRPVLRAGGRVALLRTQKKVETVQIDLSRTAFGDDDLARVSEWPDLPFLWSLNLSGTDVTDAGLQPLGRLSQLNHLDLSRTQITDVGLGELKGLTWLRHLTLEGLSERLGDAAVADLKRALPKLEIHW